MDDKKDLLFAGSDNGIGHILSPNTEACPKCGNPPNKFYVANYDSIWRDGDVMCPCGHRVRGYDAG